MFKTYWNRSGYVKFGYVYDDTDGTCEAVSVEDIRMLDVNGVELNTTEDFSYITKDSAYYSKIRIMYNLSGDVSVFNLFKYYVDDNHMTFTLVLGVDSCYVNIKTPLYIFGDGKMVIWNPVRHVARFLIPAEMAIYILRLYNEHSFREIMKAFNGYLGSNIYKFTDDTRVGKVKLDKWLKIPV